MHTAACKSSQIECVGAFNSSWPACQSLYPIAQIDTNLQLLTRLLCAIPVLFHIMTPYATAELT